MDNNDKYMQLSTKNKKRNIRRQEKNNNSNNNSFQIQSGTTLTTPTFVRTLPHFPNQRLFSAGKFPCARSAFSHPQPSCRGWVGDHCLTMAQKVTKGTLDGPRAPVINGVNEKRAPGWLGFWGT